MHLLPGPDNPRDHCKGEEGAAVSGGPQHAKLKWNEWIIINVKVVRINDMDDNCWPSF